MQCVATFLLRVLAKAIHRSSRAAIARGSARTIVGVTASAVGASPGATCSRRTPILTFPTIVLNRSMRTPATRVTSTATTTSPSHPSPIASNPQNSTTYPGGRINPAAIFCIPPPPIPLPRPWRCGKINMSKRRFIWRLRSTLRLVTEVYSYLFYMKKPPAKQGAVRCGLVRPFLCQCHSMW